MTTVSAPHLITPEERRQLEELYRQQVSAVRTLARLLGYPCPIVSREERRAGAGRPIDVCAILEVVEGCGFEPR